jgi:sugar lactone lactonase YvrE
MPAPEAYCVKIAARGKEFLFAPDEGAPMPDHSVRVVVHDNALVAESPMWSAAQASLYWLDGRRDAVYRLDTRDGTRSEWTTPSKVNGLALAAGGLIVAMKSGIALLDTSSGVFERIAEPERGNARMRMNDAKLDRAGRFWFSSMEDDGAAPIGRIFVLSGDGTLRVVDDGFTIPNGFAWSPDNRRMYLADSKLRTIFQYDFDLETGAARNRRPFVEAAPLGAPDGATTDAQGYLWSACLGGFALARYAPDGTVDRTVELPVERPTSVMFGGPELKTLFVTTASRALTPEALAAQPLAGAVLALDVEVPGLPEAVFTASPL